MYFTTAGPLNYAEADVRLRMERAIELTEDGERGASAIEWVVISAILIIIAGAVGGILLTKLKKSAEGLELTPSVGP
jgi:Flp pilus assembly pilin Flp